MIIGYQVGLYKVSASFAIWSVAALQRKSPGTNANGLSGSSIIDNPKQPPTPPYTLHLWAKEVGVAEQSWRPWVKRGAKK